MEEATNPKNKKLGIIIAVIVAVIVVGWLITALGGDDSQAPANDGQNNNNTGDQVSMTVDSVVMAIGGYGWECRVQESDPPTGICAKDGNQLVVVDKSRFDGCTDGVIENPDQMQLLTAGNNVLVISEAETPWDGFADEIANLATSLGDGYEASNLAAVCQSA